MPEALAKSSSFANSDTDAVVGNSRRSLRLNAVLMQKSRDFFPVKTAMHLSDITGYSTRACERWLSEKTVLPSDALAALIQSEWGRDYLACVMTDTTPRWWMRLVAIFKRIDIEVAEAQAARRYRELLDDEASRTHAYPASLYVQDEPFMSGQLTPAPAMVRRRK